MRRRFRRSAAIVVGVVLALYFAPQLPPVRSALLDFGLALAARNGYTVTYGESAGNLWHTLALTDLRVEGKGAQTSVRTLELSYTLPALLGGKLPLSVATSGVAGTLDLKALLPAQGAAAKPPPAPARRARITPVLRDLDVSDVALSVRGVPYYPAAITLTRLEAQQDAGALTFDAALTAGRGAGRGAAAFSGRATLAPFRLDATLERADVALARPYFDGARAGYFGGDVRARGNDVEADLELYGGKVDIVGIGLTEVSGPVTLRDLNLTTELTGRALGGSLQGSGTVDLRAQHWQGNVTGKAQLGDALVWLGQGRLSPKVVGGAFGAEGAADVELTLGGWQRFTLTGSARGAGKLLREPLTDLGVAFTFATDDGLRTSATAALGGRPLQFRLEPKGTGFTLRADGADLPLYGFRGDVDVDLESQRGKLTGSTNLKLTRTLLGRRVELGTTATTDGEVWRARLSGQDARGARATGNVTLRGPNIRGGVTLTRLELPGLADPVTARVQTDGPLSALPLTLQLSGTQGVHPTAGGARATDDFSGRAEALFMDGTLKNVRGGFGPLQFRGALSNLRYTLAPTPLSGRASGRVALEGGRLRRENGLFRTDATLRSQNLAGAGLTLPDLNASLSFSSDGAPSARLQDPGTGIDLTLKNGLLNGSFSGTQVGALGETFGVGGTVQAQTGNLPGTLELDLSATTSGRGPGTTLRATGSGANTRLSLQSEAGATLAGRTLGDNLRLSGNASLTERRAALSGTLGRLQVSVDAAPDRTGTLRTRAQLGSGREALTADFQTPQRWRTEGTLALGEIGTSLGLPLQGTLQTDLRNDGGRFSGTATLRGQVFGLPFSARARGQGETLTVEASSTVLGQQLTLVGDALPETNAVVQLGRYGEVRLRGEPGARRLTGSGTVPGLDRAGLTVKAQPWQLAGDLATGRARLELGRSVLSAVRGPSGWTLSAALEQPATLRGRPVQLRANVTRTPQTPDGSVGGSLSLDGTPLTLGGTLRDLNLSGTLPAASLQAGLTGALELTLSADALGQRFGATGRWTHPDGREALRLSASGRRSDVQGDLTADGLNIRFSTAPGSPSAQLEATAFPLERLPVAALKTLGGRLDGAMTLRNGYEGTLNLTTGLGNAELRGLGERLVLRSTFGRGTLRAAASGQLLPTLAVELEAASGNTFTLGGVLTGSVAQPKLQATFKTAALNLGSQATLPAQTLELSGSLTNGLRAALVGKGVNLRLQEGRWAGELELPFTLRDEPHRLSGAVAGDLTTPALRANVRGPVITGPLSVDRSGLEAELGVTPNVAALPDARLTLGLEAEPDLSWRAVLTGNATLPYRDLPVRLGAELTGRNARYEGSGVLEAAGETVSLTLSGEGGNVQGNATLDSIALETFVPATGTLTGDVRLNTATGLRYFANLKAQGEATGQPFDLSLQADTSELSVTGTAAGAKLSLSGRLPLRNFNLTLADGAQPLDFTTFVSLGPQISVQGAGGWRGQALSVNGIYTAQDGSARMRLALGDAELEAQLRTRQNDRPNTPDTRSVTLALDAPNGLPVFTSPVQAEAELDLDGSAITLRTLNAAVADNRLELSGTVRPHAELSGLLTVPTGGVAPSQNPVALTLGSLETGYLLALRQQNLELRSVLNSRFRPERVRLEGNLSRQNGPRTLRLESDLVWQEGQGFSGHSDLAVTFNQAVGATLTLSGAQKVTQGQTGLRIQGDASYQETRVLSLLADLSPAPWRDQDLTGRLELDAPASKLLTSWPGEPLRLSGRLDLSGTLSDPALAGPLALRGALRAAGDLEADRQGADLSLLGAGLNLSASADTKGYRSTLTLGELDLSRVLPQLARASQRAQSWNGTGSAAPPTLSGALRAVQTWGAEPLVQLSDLSFRSASSTLRGRGRYDGTLTADLELDAELSNLSPALRGSVRGPLHLGARRPLSGTLTLFDLGPSAADWGLSGGLRLAGSVASPKLGLTLNGSGSATGGITGELAPRSGSVSLRSDLNVEGVRTDFTLTRTQLGVSAAGTLRYRTFAARLSTRQRQITVTGLERLEGWRGTYSPAGLSLAGPLAGVNPQLRGRLELTSTATLQRLRGVLIDAALGPVALGDLAISETDLPSGRALELRGRALDGSVGLSGALPWHVTKLALSLPGDTRVRATGRGDRQAGTVQATIATSSLSLPVSASYAAGAVALASRGDMPVGVLDVQARLQAGRWHGGATVTDRDAADTHRILESRLSGNFSDPRIQGTLELRRGENAARGSFSVTRAAATLTTTLTSPQLGAPLRLRAYGWPLRLALSSRRQTLRLTLQEGKLVPSGALSVRAGPATLALRPQTPETLNLRVEVPSAPGLALRTTLPTRPSDFSALLGGLELRGAARTRGSLTLKVRPALSLSADALSWRGDAGTLTLSGTGRYEAGLQGAFRGRWQGAAGAPLPWLRTVNFPFSLRAEGQRFALSSAGALGGLEARYDTETRNATLQSDLKLGEGRVVGELEYTRENGPSGTLGLTSVPIFSVEDEPATVSSELALSPSGVSGSGALRFAGSEAELAGQAGWARLLPQTLRRAFPQAGQTLAAQIRLNRFDLGNVPPLKTRVPYLSAPISGVATLAGTQIVGQLVAPNLRVLDTQLPTQVDFNGTFGALEARATFGDSRLNLTYDRSPGNGRLAGLLSLETFPLQVLAEAVVGASQVDASATGAARFNLSLGDLRASYVRLATERLTLRSTAAGAQGGGPTTEGSVSLRFENGSLYVERADFQGDGSWRAQGILTPQTLDFTFDARDADFSPLLRLVPRLAVFNIGAQGTLKLEAQGSAAEPDISLTSPGLELSVAGSRYRVRRTDASLRRGTFALDSDIVGVSPIGGAITLRGSGEVTLNPVRTRDLELRFSGDANIPTLGNVTALRGRLYPATSGWQLNGRGALGSAFTVTGGLAPLDLRLRGQNLNIQAPRFFLDSSSTNVNLRVRSETGNFAVSGAALVSGAQLSLNRAETDAGGGSDPPARAAPRSETGAGAPQGSGTAGAEAPTSAAEAIRQVIARTPNPVLTRVVFQGIELRAPRQVFFESGFGSAELGFDVTLSGTAARPQLTGEASTLQGTISFSGQDFTIEQATATFDPTQGVYPTLDLDAAVSFDKAQALGNLANDSSDLDTLPDYTLPDPAGSSFVAQLAISGSFERSPTGRRALNLEPTLSSNATLQVAAGTPRPLNEPELLTLLTLGRLQLDAPIVGTNGLAETVATTALDTAVDLFLVSELQDALSNVLGVDLEIRTSALSSVLGPDPQEFGLSVKLGGYLSDNLFASIEVGRFDDPDQAYALTNEFTLRYTAAPLELNFTGGVNFSEDAAQAAVTDFSLGLSYALTTRLSLDASLATDDSGQDTSIGFGVSFVW